MLAVITVIVGELRDISIRGGSDDISGGGGYGGGGGGGGGVYDVSISVW